MSIKHVFRAKRLSRPPADIGVHHVAIVWIGDGHKLGATLFLAVRLLGTQTILKYVCQLLIFEETHLDKLLKVSGVAAKVDKRAWKGILSCKGET